MNPKEKAAAAAKAAADLAAENKRKADEATLAAQAKAKDDELAAMRGALTNLTTQLAQIGGQVNILATERTAPAPVVNKGFQRTVTIEDIDRAIDEGDTKRVNTLQLKYNTETIQEQMAGVSTQTQSLQHQGVSMIANVVKDQISGKLPHYERFKKEIDEFLEKAPMEARTAPEMHRWAHDAIVGRHTEELMKEAAEAAVRKHMDGGSGYNPGAGSGSGGSDSQGTLTIDTVYGDDAKDIKRLLQSKNITIDQYAQRRGFANAQAYLTHVKKFRDEERLEAM